MLDTAKLPGRLRVRRLEGQLQACNIHRLHLVERFDRYDLSMNFGSSVWSQLIAVDDVVDFERPPTPEACRAT